MWATRTMFVRSSLVWVFPDCRLHEIARIPAAYPWSALCRCRPACARKNASARPASTPANGHLLPPRRRTGHRLHRKDARQPRSSPRCTGDRLSRRGRWSSSRPRATAPLPLRTPRARSRSPSWCRSRSKPQAHRPSQKSRPMLRPRTALRVPANRAATYPRNLASMHLFEPRSSFARMQLVPHAVQAGEYLGGVAAARARPCGTLEVPAEILVRVRRAVAGAVGRLHGVEGLVDLLIRNPLYLGADGGDARGPGGEVAHDGQDGGGRVLLLLAKDVRALLAHEHRRARKA